MSDFSDVPGLLMSKYGETFLGFYVISLGEGMPKDFQIVTDKDVYTSSGHNETQIPKGVELEGVWMSSMRGMWCHLGKTPEEAAGSVWDWIGVLKLRGERVIHPIGLQ